MFHHVCISVIQSRVFFATDIKLTMESTILVIRSWKTVWLRSFFTLVYVFRYRLRLISPIILMFRIVRYSVVLMLNVRWQSKIHMVSTTTLLPRFIVMMTRVKNSRTQVIFLLMKKHLSTMSGFRKYCFIFNVWWEFLCKSLISGNLYFMLSFLVLNYMSPN